MPRIAKAKSGFMVFNEDNVPQPISTERNEYLAVMWVYPFIAPVDGSTVPQDNAQDCRVGVKNSGSSILFGKLSPGDPPLSIPIPPAENGTQQQIAVRDVLAQGTKNDGVYWFGYGYDDAS